MRRTFSTLAVASLLVSLSSPAGAQQAPPDGHGGGSGAGPSGGGSSAQSIPLALPPARGGIPVPLSVVYDGGTRLGELGMGWSIPFSYVERPTTLAHTRPKYFADPNAAAEPLDRVYLVLGGNRMLMVRVATDTYRPMVGPQGMELIQESVSSWRLNDGSGRVYRFRQNFGLGEQEGFWPLEEVNDATGLNPVKLFYDLQHVPLGSDVTDVTKMAKELSLIGIEYNQQPGGGCAKHRIEIEYDAARPDPPSLRSTVGSGLATAW